MGISVEYSTNIHVVDRLDTLKVQKLDSITPITSC